MTSFLPLRRVRVGAVRPLTPRMTRVTLGGPERSGFALAGPDQQVKLFFPRPGGAALVLPGSEDGDGDVMRWYAAYGAIPADRRPWMRSYTLRAHDPAAGTVDVDFHLHGGADEGPATRWARSARPGDEVGMFGPSAYFATPLNPTAGDWTLLTADACALPALTTVAEALPAGRKALAFVQVADAQEHLPLTTDADLAVHWLHDDDPAALPEAVRTADLPPGTPYAWLAGEATAVRTLRRHLVETRRVPRPSIHFTGYWRHHLPQDAAPTPADLAEARERLADTAG
ncbi:siderophore-interacting protein [Streptomyces sp. HUAS MG47]|uniref:siderophore-interacting protein n=1 Tax=Streptomyces solicamelliae TaxID=3231716 RepID=UPI00387830AD